MKQSHRPCDAEAVLNVIDVKAEEGRAKDLALRHPLVSFTVCKMQILMIVKIRTETDP